MIERTESAPGRTFWSWLLVIVLAALALRIAFPTADPPWATTVGVVWHDEGAWVHNARNKALWGRWTEDAWNPMYIAPVFTALEYVSFALFGVGVWQARLLSELSGVASIVLLACGVRRVAGREAGLMAGALVACDYVYVMWNRAALMEASMVAFIVAGWYCYARAQTQPIWGAAAAVCALLAYFTKAAAVFFLAALGLEALIVLGWARAPGHDVSRRAAVATLAGLGVGSLVALATFVVPNWADYRFYNWQMSVTRKPSYDLRSLVNRVTWFPVVHDIFTRTWFIVVVGVTGCLGILARVRTIAPATRLLSLWIGLGVCELLLHDVGNERRFIFLIPALAGVTGIVLGHERRLLPEVLAQTPRRVALLALPVVGYGLYVMAGSLTRLVALYEPRPGVRLGAAIAALATVAIYAAWPGVTRALSGRQWSVGAAVAVTAIVCGGALVQYAQWMRTRTYKNYLASIAVGRALPPGTLVHGKLANGLSLENRIKPVFVGRGFGNYDDRTQRDDVRYILTYVAPYVGYEGPVIRDVLEANPGRTIIQTFEVAESATGHDRAALIDKVGATGTPGPALPRPRGAEPRD